MSSLLMAVQVTAVTDCVIYRLRRSDLVVSVEKSTELKIRLRRHREEEAKRKQDEETAAMAASEEKELAEWKAEATGKDAHQVGSRATACLSLSLHRS